MTTEAGRRLLGNQWLVNPYGEGYEAMQAAVLAIEAEAREQERARIRAAVEALEPTAVDGTVLNGMRFRWTWLDRAAVLAIIEERKP